jgi:hypothetical protein
MYSDDPQIFINTYPSLDPAMFSWDRFRRPTLEENHDEVAATKALVEYIRVALRGLQGRSGFDVYDVHGTTTLLSQQFDAGEKLSGTTDAIVAPYGLANSSSIHQARFLFDFKTPKAMDLLLRQLRRDLTGVGPSTTYKSGAILAQFCCALAKSNMYAPVVFTDMVTAIVLRATGSSILHFDVGVPARNMLAFVCDHLSKVSPSPGLVFERDLSEDHSGPIEMMRAVKKRKAAHALVQQLYGPCGLIEDHMDFDERFTIARQVPNINELMYI